MPFDGIAEDFTVNSLERPRQLTPEDAAYLTTLRRARELVAQGWTQGAYLTYEEVEGTKSFLFFFKVKTRELKKHYCMLGAWREALPTSDIGLREHLYARFSQRPEFAGAGLNVPSWNDHSARTHAEVLAVFDREIESVTA